ncbi:RNA polymerase sigma factor [Dyadobacter jiangsuensis]|uniref:RNA polymerase sigma-70 factor (ECF subfamily) n=1 Tax=Dyadobacter jiangsuensis TaxID=1591085 RepID=A0A2P8G5U0_9BACT|nr:RNA polymerase sigma factor [Dyadobacter jiangsuensis]PSL29339.1 RNA polymerase sigma-70 factor (ECF subfamily) [Dyadobacter jiangsuensis]
MVETRSNSCSEHNSTDEELVRLFLESRDNRHFQKLYERYALKVYQKCVTLTKDATRAEDVMHDVFLKLIHKMSSFKTGAKFSTWLFTITHNHCMDLARVSKRRVILVHEAETPEGGGKEELCLQGLFEEEVNLIMLKEALDLLDLEDKAMIYLRYLDDRSIRDIASLFRITESAVKMRLMRSRRKLRRWYHKLSEGSNFF